MIEALLTALAKFNDPLAIGMIFLGAVLGIMFGALPGFSPVTGLALLLPFTFGMDPMIAMILFAGVIGSAHFGGSIPSILLNTPGTAPNACTCFDGFPLARKGQAARALAISATSAGVATVIGLAALMLAIPIIRPFILSFMTPDFFWLVVFGLVTISFASKGNLLKGLAGGGIGVLLAFIGYSGLFAIERFTFNSHYLWDGLKLVPLVIGIFAISEIISYASKGGTISQVDMAEKGKGVWWRQVKQGMKDVLSRPVQVIRGSLIGVVIGAIPGVGGSAANFISYTVAMQNSKHAEEYGRGSIDGLIASETANDAKDGPAILPTVAFGIPGSPDTAILLAALILHGLTPGPLLLRDDLPIVMMLVLGIFFSQIFTSSFGLFSANLLARITVIRVQLLAPFVLILCIAGAFAYRQYIWDVLLAVLFGVIGYLFKRYDFRVITILIGYMLGSMVERYFHTSLRLAQGSYTVFVSNPISVVLIVLILTMLLYPVIKGWLQHRREKGNKAQEDGLQIAEKTTQSAVESATISAGNEKEKFKPWKNGEFIFTAVVTAFVLLIMAVSFQYGERARMVPLLVSSGTLVLLLGLLVGHFFPELMKRMEVGLDDMLGGSSKQKCDAEEKEQTAIGSVLRIIFWIVGLATIIFLFGLPVSIPLLLLAFLLFEGKVVWWKALLIAAVGSVIFFVALNYLGVRLWLGAIPRLIPGILGGSIIPRL
ncbi:MAG: tripartite tricarboxylate transporter permease [Bacillota bacterium]|nr:tripartite tricarboxylate transporter permease [Bacillota bacterium]